MEKRVIPLTVAVFLDFAKLSIKARHIKTFHYFTEFYYLATVHILSNLFSSFLHTDTDTDTVCTIQ